MAIYYETIGAGLAVVRCLSSDTKPTTTVIEGTVLVEIDTSKHFRLESGIWVEKTNSYYATSGSTINFADSETPSGTIDGNNASFTLAYTPSSPLCLYLNGVRQRNGADKDYTISGTTITMINIPQSGDTLIVDYRY